MHSHSRERAHQAAGKEDDSSLPGKPSVRKLYKSSKESETKPKQDAGKKRKGACSSTMPIFARGDSGHNLAFSQAKCDNLFQNTPSREDSASEAQESDSTSEAEPSRNGMGRNKKAAETEQPATSSSKSTKHLQGEILRQLEQLKSLGAQSIALGTDVPPELMQILGIPSTPAEQLDRSKGSSASRPVVEEVGANLKAGSVRNRLTKQSFGRNFLSLV